MEYRPSKLPANLSEDAQALAGYLEGELQRISSSLIENIIALDLSPAHAVPLRPRTGMIVYADGTDWDPGSGEGIYTFGADAAWHFLNNVAPPAPPTVPAIASQAQQEAASDLTTIVSPGRQQFHPSAAKAWVAFNGSGTILASYNVTSVTRTATGRFTITFTTAFSSTNYQVNVSSEIPGNSTDACSCFIDSSAIPKTTTTVSLLFLNAAASAFVNPIVGHLACFGDQ